MVPGEGRLRFLVALPTEGTPAVPETAHGGAEGRTVVCTGPRGGGRERLGARRAVGG